LFGGDATAQHPFAEADAIVAVREDGDSIP
jgi:hypothetical protein